MGSQRGRGKGADQKRGVRIVTELYSAQEKNPTGREETAGEV